MTHRGGRRSGWATFGIVVAVVLAVAGLVLVGLIVLMIVSLNSWGSNK